ncbi:4-alpha-glucanotransferase [Brenneria goodwinii]|uniref:4-alpha-glucanotransferase n=1 Tax=Brenneria goodwinii TaxID=1109412 RepID=UPI000EF1EC8D|nr:4-alpha-glucanotransferase [Brenneria goodwinii]MCG8156975.1 4-alpha-glucanotransferase [Brenneria goodwinii]MCG8161326.1 4-alpha-glucanotransferase [Brenneria goodwinii]MCG8168027.1 4-alpha-glucanotransferase [Brenneria goodwinii]MCG8172703.1 4-alpha-glucanotransferase [Brenneria goodwinii]MCG8175559.1 4-alpha-glucanotransferase [Brenneria goodwinii]
MAFKADNPAIQSMGIAETYTDAYGNEHIVDASIRDRLLAMMDISGSGDTPLPPVKVFLQGRDAVIKLAGSGEFHWTLTYENGGQVQGKATGGANLTLPAELPLGYHHITLEQGDLSWNCRVAIAPHRCYEPEALTQGKRWWGVNVQLYTLRSQNNWGVGDFGDLRQLVEQIARRGGAFVGLNPLHSLYPAVPGAASPYSPSSRHWLNIIYIDVNRVDDFQQSPEAQLWWRQEDTQRTVSELRAERWVDYEQVTALKLSALRLAFRYFNTRSSLDPRVNAFRQFVANGGQSLQLQATFDALQAYLKHQGEKYANWLQWPLRYRDIHGKSVKSFSHERADEIRFYCWLQWLAYEQLAECFAHAKQLGLPIGLYRDLAVGVAQGGAETWDERQLYCLDASIGAPPDPLGPQGQNWQLSPMNPRVMQLRGYQPFIDVLRNNMASCGALRIDHVMALMRLWWIPKAEPAGNGAYVHYPLDDLLAILALESQRHRCLVIGEDLGTVPPQIVSKLHDFGIYSYKVLFFEQDEQHCFRPPDKYLRQAMATITTHDLPTLRGYWQAVDLSLGRDLGLYPDAGLLQQQMQLREKSKQGLLNALHQQGLLPQRVGRNSSLTTMGMPLNRGVHRYMADSASALVGFQLEDWLDMFAPVNVPGTDREYPNWRRKLSRTLESLFTDRYLERLIRDIDLRRGAPGK